MKSSALTLTDQFCGAGGSSIGATEAGMELRVAMNHWKLAIETHSANFQNAAHDCTDISAVDPRRYPSTNMLITSPECTNHSLAKGKKRAYYAQDLFGNVLLDPSEERSRATMWDVPRFAGYHDYELIIAENVVDAGKWILFDAWLKAMHDLGYEHEVVYFNSMFAWPTPQSRDRMYTIFWKRGNRKPDLEFRPLAWCERCQVDVESIQTWKRPTHWGRYKKQYFYRCPTCHQAVEPYYYAAFNAIDFSIPAERIGNRKKPLKPSTMARVRYGLETYGRKPMIVTTRYTSGVASRVHDAMQETIPTQPGDASHAVLMPWMVETKYSHAPGNRSKSTISPVMTQTTEQSIGLVVPPFIVKTVRGQNEYSGALESDQPLWTQTTCQDAGLVAPRYVVEMHRTSKAHGLLDPLLCVTAGGNHHALISSDAFLTYYYHGQQVSSPADPIGTITTTDRISVVNGALEAMSVDDLTFRMFTPPEIGRAMAFQDTYIVLGTGREQVKQYGNAVTPPAMKMLVKRCAETLR